MEDRCETCGGPLVYLGDLGSLMWFKCRNCGLEQNVEAADEPWDDGGDDNGKEW